MDAKQEKLLCGIDLPNGLREARFVFRRNRFVGEIEIEGRAELAHVPSSGRMRELLYPGADIFVAPARGPQAKLGYRILLAYCRGRLVSVDSLLPNRLVRKALVAGVLPGLKGCRAIRPEVSYGHGRFDFYFEDASGAGCYLEVKSVTLVEGGVALFPDAPSERGARHMEELAAARREGYRAVVLFIIQRDDAQCFSPHRERDPLFSDGLCRASGTGVEVMAMNCRVSTSEVCLDRQVPVICS